MKTSIIIEARSSSRRLPKKILLNAYKNITFLEYLVSRLKTLNFVDNIIVATTVNKNDDEIIRLSEKLNVNYYRGPENKVLTRVLGAARKFRTDLIIRITSDCPVIDLNIVRQAYEIYMNNDVEFVTNSLIPTYPIGMDVEVLQYKTLKKSTKFIKSTDDEEHITLAIRRNPKKFKHLNLIAPRELHYPKMSLVLDYKQDAIVLKKVIKKFWNKDFRCFDLINFILKNKSISKINKNLFRTTISYE
jgi:spore coat polysaccharide biosynthesis protein SpsF